MINVNVIFTCSVVRQVAKNYPPKTPENICLANDDNPFQTYTPLRTTPIGIQHSLCSAPRSLNDDDACVHLNAIHYPPQQQQPRSIEFPRKKGNIYVYSRHVAAHLEKLKNPIYYRRLPSAIKRRNTYTCDRAISRGSLIRALKFKSR